jgi:hypothetical protein
MLFQAIISIQKWLAFLFLSFVPSQLGLSFAWAHEREKVVVCPYQHQVKHTFFLNQSKECVPADVKFNQNWVVMVV